MRLNRVCLLKLVLGFCSFALLTCLAHDTSTRLIVIFCGQPRFFFVFLLNYEYHKNEMLGLQNPN